MIHALYLPTKDVVKGPGLLVCLKECFIEDDLVKVGGVNYGMPKHACKETFQPIHLYVVDTDSSKIKPGDIVTNNKRIFAAAKGKPTKGLGKVIKTTDPFSIFKGVEKVSENLIKESVKEYNIKFIK